MVTESDLSLGNENHSQIQFYLNFTFSSSISQQTCLDYFCRLNNLLEVFCHYIVFDLHDYKCDLPTIA